MPKHSDSHQTEHGNIQIHKHPHRTLKHTFFARPRPLHILIVVIFVVFGTALVTQVKAKQSDPLENLTENELVELLAEMDSRGASLEAQKSELEDQLEELSSEANQLANAQDAAKKLALQAQIAAGTLPVAGPGIVIGIADSSEALTAQTFVTTLAELRNAGAEAIEINDIRLTLRSWFSQDEGSIIVDGTRLSAPYTWRVIGDPDTLSSGIEIRGGAASQMRALGATVTIQRKDEMTIDSVAQTFTPSWAKPTES